MDTNTYMPVAPMNYGGDFGGMNGWWIILLFLFAGFGNGFGGFGGNNAYPWMNTNNDVQRGFDQSIGVLFFVRSESHGDQCERTEEYPRQKEAGQDDQQRQVLGLCEESQ